MTKSQAQISAARNAIDWKVMRQYSPTLAAMLANSINATKKVPSVEAPGGKVGRS